MRIKIVVDVGGGITLPINYNHLLAGVIYRFLAESAPEYASFLHNEFTQGRLRCRRKTFQTLHLLATHGRTQTHHGCDDPFRFNVDVVRFLRSRTVLIPF